MNTKNNTENISTANSTKLSSKQTALKFNGWQEGLSGTPTMELWTVLETGSTRSRASLEAEGYYVPVTKDWSAGMMYWPKKETIVKGKCDSFCVRGIYGGKLEPHIMMTDGRSFVFSADYLDCFSNSNLIFGIYTKTNIRKIIITMARRAK
jgi:hypothetical protein